MNFKTKTRKINHLFYIAGFLLLIIFVTSILLPVNTVMGHPGRTDRYGGHYVRTAGWGYPVGSYHYHNGGYSSGNNSSYSSSTVQAVSNSMKATVPSYPIKINSVLIDNTYNLYPIVNYKGITYIPLTTKVCESLGISLTWNEVYGLNLIQGYKPYYYYFDIEQDSSKNNYVGKTITVSSPSFIIKINNKQIYNSLEEYPFIVYNSITYMPLTWDNVYSKFGMSMSWDEIEGLNLWR